MPAALRVFSNHGQDCRYNGPIEVTEPVTATYGMGGNNQPLIVENHPTDGRVKVREDDTCQTLTYCTSKNSHHTVAAHEQANTLVASDWKDPPVVNDVPNDELIYIVRRLTPMECARLQGFPDWWCSDLAIPEPTDEDIAFWTEVWETWRQVTNPNGKPKTEKQIRKWLADPYTDSAEYKLWGNGIALPCAHFVLSGIAWAAQIKR